MRFATMVLALTIVLAAAIAIPVAHAEGSVAFEMLASGNVPACPHVLGLECARTPEEFTALWERSCIPGPMPNVDFRHNMVIAYFDGSRLGTPTVWPEVTAVRHDKGVLCVEVDRHLGPGICCDDANIRLMIVVQKWPRQVELKVVGRL